MKPRANLTTVTLEERETRFALKSDADRRVIAYVQLGGEQQARQLVTRVNAHDALIRSLRANVCTLNAFKVSGKLAGSPACLAALDEAKALLARIDK